nr:immunoglobulin light chain junction region [Macaca mulatta]MOX23587.1 immunoglobulin light chain junction region [Macaca mulatta]MOX24298.1 immunoglobulin light chain junction region [Macaca mulatta]MOX24424.1 immunoglobulin light chain junction region [Macaca mulatta]MOX24565.1 immunoglobulin light chain junction region [Macaca mulatta]
CMQALELPFTF